jgi:hypothetical protein
MIKYSTEGLFDNIKQRIVGGVPTSIVRYGDGEAIVLNGFKDMTALKMVMKRQFGYIPKLEEIEQIRSNLIQAYTEADIIGIPVQNRFMENKDSYWYKAFGILNDAIGIDILQQKELTSIDFHSEFLEKGYWDSLLFNGGTICYVSSRDLNSAFEKRGVQPWNFQIAPEMKFSTGYTGPKHFPEQFNQVGRWITRVPVEGNICLVGAGVAGKLYCSWFKERGGIAIDCGSCFDAWAGLCTRGPGRGAGAIDETYKL